MKETCGIRLKKLIEEIGYTQIELAQEIKISNVVINRYANDRVKPNYNFMKKLIIHFNVNINWLLLGLGKMFIPREV